MSWNTYGNHKRQDVIQVPRLEPKDLYDRRVRRDHARLRSYNTLLEQIYHRVYSTSQLSGNTSSVLYNVPPFILGLPKMDMEDCIVYLVWQLRQSGFEVRFTWPNLLYISWRHHEGDYLTKHNPIIQAMIPEPIAPPKPSNQKTEGKKKQPLPKQSVAFSNEIELLTSVNQPQQIPQQRRAIDYEPPSSFLQTMERPVKQQNAKGNVLADLWTY
jgi:hypothetical protein